MGNDGSLRRPLSERPRHELRSPRIRAGLIVVGAALAFVRLAPIANAQTFAALSCATCPTWTDVAFTYQVGGGSGVWELPNNEPASLSNDYINNIYHKRWMVGNSYVSRADVRFDAFVTETNFDFFTYNRVGFGGINLTGVIAAPFWTSSTFNGASLQATPLYMIFKTDYSVTRTGFSIGAARVCCTTPLNNDVSPLNENDRFYGVLLGNNDVVYMKYYPPADRDATVALWGTGPDIDLYVRCDALPTPTQWDYRGFSWNAQEFVHVPANQCPAGHPLYVAAHALNVSGPQVFNLAVHAHHPAHHIAGYIAKTTYNADLGTLNSWKGRLNDGARRFFGLTEGSIYPTTVEVRNNTGTGENIRINSGSGRANSGLCTGVINLYPGNDGRTVAHESGHFFGCLNDEYHDVSGGSQSHCGHSFMGNFYQSQMNNNFCYCNSWNGSVCAANEGDHNTDGNVVPNSIRPPAWNVFPTRPYINYPTATPDNYNYVNFDFNNLVGNF